MTYTKMLPKHTTVWATESVNQTDEQAFLLTSGNHRTRDDGTIDRWVHLSFRGKAVFGPWRYAYTQVTPDEARSLAAMLLDAADDADERMG